MLISMLFPTVLATGSGTNPPSNGYGTLTMDQAAGAFPATVDPANCYDTASGELIFNCMETLLFFDGERYDQFIPMLATQVWVGPPAASSPAYTNCSVYFKIRGTNATDGSGSIPFVTWCRTDSPATWSQYYLKAADVAYCIERFLVRDFVGAAAWMWYEPLLDRHVGNTSDPNWGQKISNAFGYNNTYVWINLCNPGLAAATGASSWHGAPVKMFLTEDGVWDSNFFANLASEPLDYAMKIFFQVIAQPWMCIYSKQWVINYVNTALPTPYTPWPGPYAPPAGLNLPAEWDGSNETRWLYYTQWGADQSPFDKLPLGAATPGVMCGTGPYILDRYAASAGWSCVRNKNYWRTWPATELQVPYPPAASSGINTGGYVDRFTVVNTVGTSGRISDLQSGAADLAAVPRSRAGELHRNSDRTAETLAGIRLNYPIATLQVESQHYTFYVDNPSGWGTNGGFGIIYSNDSVHADGIPSNFFSNIHVRNAFTYLFNDSYSINSLFYGECYQPFTCAPNGLAFVNTLNPMWPNKPREDLAAQEIAQAMFGATNLSQVGFTITLCYYDAAGGVREASVLDHAAAINKLGTDYFGGRFTANTLNVPWADFIPDIDAHVLPTFRVGWLADYADIYDFVFPYLDYQGDYGKAQRFDPTEEIQSEIHGNLTLAVRNPSATIYNAVQLLGYQYNPTVFILCPVGRGYQREWVQGFSVEYDPLYPGIYARFVWKWLYKRGNVNYDNRVSMDDVMAVVNAFGSYAVKAATIGGVPIWLPVFQARWNFHCDVDGDPKSAWSGTAIVADGGWRNRQITMTDIMAVIGNFGAHDTPWQPLLPQQYDQSVGFTVSGAGGNWFTGTGLLINESAISPPYTITYSDTNLGNTTIAATTVYLEIEGVATANSGAISLNPGQTRSFTYSWSPSAANPDYETTAFGYNITVYAPAYLTESVLWNNLVEEDTAKPYDKDLDVTPAETPWNVKSTSLNVTKSVNFTVNFGVTNMGMLQVAASGATCRLYINLTSGPPTLVKTITNTDPMNFGDGISGTYKITNMVAGDYYNITAYAPALSGETYTDNNVYGNVYHVVT